MSSRNRAIKREAEERRSALELVVTGRGGERYDAAARHLVRPLPAIRAGNTLSGPTAIADEPLPYRGQGVREPVQQVRSARLDAKP